MHVAVMKIRVFLPWAGSLKDKRMERRSLIDKIRRRFNVSVAEVEAQDTHQLLVLGIAAIAGDTAQADSILDRVWEFTQRNTEGEITCVYREIR